MGRIYISAGHKSSGKTTLSIGLCAALSQQGRRVQPFKKGPDYIDPLWLANASSINQTIGHRRSCYNLDFNTQSHNEIIYSFNHYGDDADISIIEGNKGLHDGVALNGSDSNAAMAKLTESPVILIIDARGVTRGVAPLLLGYQAFDEEVNIAGVIYNFCAGARHEQKLRAVTEEFTDIPVLGLLRKSTTMDLSERHLGLMPCNETKDAKNRISEIAQFVTGSVDLSKVIDCANTATELPNLDQSLIVNSVLLNYQQQKHVRIGICEDSAFGFYYADDKQALVNAGAELVSINTLTDAELPNDIDGLFIGGGFPETQMKELEANDSMRKSIYGAVELGLPTYAECGGLMYLSESIQWKNESAEMVGIIPATAKMNKKPQGKGYVKLEETDQMPWVISKDRYSSSKMNAYIASPLVTTSLTTEANTINAHEFHYSSLESHGAESDPVEDKLTEKGMFAFKVIRGVGITGQNDGWVYKNLLANYSHIRHTRSFPWANRFVDFVRCNSNKNINNNIKKKLNTKLNTNDDKVNSLANVSDV